MFKLDHALADWRRQMLAAGIKAPEPLNELETHVREEMERQVRGGLGVQQAFGAAVQRLGPAQALEAEFAKAAEPKAARERRVKLLCIAGSVLAYLAPLALSAPKPWSGMNGTEIWLGLAAVALTALSPFSGLYLHGLLPIIPVQRIRTRVQFAAALPALVWLCVFAYIVLPRVELATSQVTVLTLWALSPLALLGGLILGLDEAARRADPAWRLHQAKD
jgi:hypothetical protein